MESQDIDVDFVPERKGTVASIEIEGEGLLFDEDDGAWHHLNPIARLIWVCCDGTGSIAEIARDLSDTFEADAQEVTETVLETLRRFGEHGLLAGVERQRAHAHGHSHSHAHELDTGSEEAPKPRFLDVPPSS